MDSQDVANLKKQLREQGYSLYVHSHPAGMCFPEQTRPHVILHVVLNGTLRIEMDGHEYVLNSGDQLEVPAHMPYAAEVLGDFPVVCIDATK